MKQCDGVLPGKSKHADVSPYTQVTAEAVKVLKVVEKCVPDVTFNFQEHLLGGVSHISRSFLYNDCTLRVCQDGCCTCIH